MGQYSFAQHSGPFLLNIQYLSTHFVPDDFPALPELPLNAGHHACEFAEPCPQKMAFPGGLNSHHSLTQVAPAGKIPPHTTLYDMGTMHLKQEL